MTRLVDTDDLLDDSSQDLDTSLHTVRLEKGSRWAIVQNIHEDEESDHCETFRTNNEEETLDDDENWPSSGIEPNFHSSEGDYEEDFDEEPAFYAKNVQHIEDVEDEELEIKTNVRSAVSVHDLDENDVDDNFEEQDVELTTSEESDGFDTDALLTPGNTGPYETEDLDEEAILLPRPAKRLRRVKSNDIKERSRAIMATVPKLTKISANDQDPPKSPTSPHMMERIASQSNGSTFNVRGYICSY
jgi:hypothetical protein